MGCSPSNNRDPDLELHNPTMQQRNDSINRGDRHSKEFQILDILKQEYSENFELFLVNNLLLSVQFFEDFNEDIKILQPNSDREIEISKLNERLLQHYQKKIILPDTLHEKVNKNIRFQRPDEDKSESFLPERLFIVDDNVEISHVDEEAYYTIDKNTFRAALVESDNVGFVKLRQMDPRETPSGTPDSSHKSSGESLGKDIYIDPQPSTSTSADIIESNYAELEEARSKKALVIAIDGKLYSTISKRFIVPITTVESKKEYNEKESSHAVRENTVLTENYISSREMAKYFIHVEFPKRIGPVLGFTSEELQNAEIMLATIYLQSNRSGYSVNYEVTSVLDIQWPKFCTLHWLHRKPVKIKDKINHIIYEWPSTKMKNYIQGNKCVVIPRGCLQKYRANPQKNLEWEIAYPRVEKFLQTTMSHSQTKTYFLLILLHKSFIEPVTKHQGIISDHIKMLMYWEIERNFLQWPETRMGRKLSQILMRLEDCLSHSRLQHYFHHHKNIFNNIREGVLYKAQTIINNIVQNPVPYVLSALMNVRYSNPSTFYPMFEYEELYHQLRGENIVARPVPRVERSKTVTFGRTTHKKLKANIPKKREIDLKWICKIDRSETIRRRNILVMFIKHFIEIGKQSSVRLITEQALLYLQHAMDLTIILEQESPLHKVEVNEFMHTIETEQSRVRRATPSEFTADPTESPALPLRVSTLRATSA